MGSGTGTGSMSVSVSVTLTKSTVHFSTCGFTASISGTSPGCSTNKLDKSHTIQLPSSPTLVSAQLVLSNDIQFTCLIPCFSTSIQQPSRSLHIRITPKVHADANKLLSGLNAIIDMKPLCPLHVSANTPVSIFQTLTK